MRSFIEKNLQSILNHYLALDPESASRLLNMQNKSVKIELLDVNLIFQLIFTSDEIQLKTNDFIPANATIRGTPISLMHMAISKDNRKKFFEDDVTIEGDVALGQKVIDLFDSLEIDWEEYLSHWIGDIPAHQTGRVVRHFKNFTQQFRKTITQNMNEYVHEEVNLCPPREALQDFFHDVDNLRMDTDRLEARIAKLQSIMEKEA